MSKISGRIVVKETGAGVPGLLVTAQMEKETTGVSRTSARAASASPAGARRGSAVTGPDGSFAIPLPDGAAVSLSLAVTAPEESGRGAPAVLHVSPAAFRGPQDAVLIRVPADKLKAAEVPVPSAGAGAASAQEIIARTTALENALHAVDKGEGAAAALRLQRSTAVRKIFKETMAPAILESLSQVSAALRNTATFVKPGQSVEGKSLGAMQQDILNLYNTAANRPAVRGRVSLTEEQKGALARFRQGDVFKDVPGETVIDAAGTTLDQAVRGAATGTGSFITREDPLAALEEPSPERACAEANMGLSPAPSGEDDAPAGEPSDNSTAGAVPTDIPKFVARFLAHATAPEGPVALGAGGLANAGAVQKTVDTFSLLPGPADTPAFHDFHQLRIAFEPVWQEAIDQGILDAAEDAYQTIVERGGTPPPPPSSNPASPVANTFFIGNWSVLAGLMQSGVPEHVLMAFVISLQEWNMLEARSQAWLKALAEAINTGQTVRDPYNLPLFTVPAPLSMLARYREMGERLIKNVRARIHASGDRYTALSKVLGDLDARLKQPYAFTLYAANAWERSVNFGLVATYRQMWDPVSYQVGRLIRTLPLAPKETVKYLKKVTVKTSRAEKEVVNSLRSRKDEMSQTRRVETDIIARALGKTNFNLAAEGSFSTGIYSGKASTSFTKDAESSSEEVKKDFHEAVMSAAQEVKDEHNVEITTSRSEDAEAEASGEVSNPNDEIAVTYLFYELQRRYRVFERIHRLSPVVMVAQEMPAPHEIDEDWLIAHDWILKRVLLDDSLSPALAYLSARLPGDEAALDELRKTVEQQRSMAEALKDEVLALKDQAGRRYQALERFVENRAQVVAGEDPADRAERIEEFFFGTSKEDREAARMREDAARDAYDKAVREEKEARLRMEREVTALASVSESYAKALSEHLNRKAQVARLQVHVKQNILYYMQAVWSHEPPDQRFFRLHKVKVPALAAQQHTYTIDVDPSPSLAETPGVHEGPMHEFTADVVIDPAVDTGKKIDLAEAADLDNLLGYKGNYMLFPLRRSNALTDFMMNPYLDAALGLHDPDDLGNWTLDEFSKYVCRLKKTLPAAEFEALKASLKEKYRVILSAPRRSGEEILVPTDSLFIEILAGAHPALEQFKQAHRQVDVKKVQAEVRAAELENVRAAARLLSEEFEDPNIEKKIVIEGQSSGITVPADEN